MTRRNRILVPVLLLLVGAGLLWVASRMAWLDVVAYNDQSGEARRTLSGADWRPALVPLALGAVAAVAAVALVRGWAARAVGAVIALLGVAAVALAWTSLGEVDADKAHSVITSGEDVARTDAGPGTEGGEAVPRWSEITSADARPAGPAVTVAGAAALLGAGAVVVVFPSVPVRRDDRYVTPAARQEAAADRDADTGRDLWQELDDGRDPTG